MLILIPISYIGGWESNTLFLMLIMHTLWDVFAYNHSQISYVPAISKFTSDHVVGKRDKQVEHPLHYFKAVCLVYIN